MRLLFHLFLNLVSLCLWPARALLRALFAPRPPPHVQVVLRGPLRDRTFAPKGWFARLGKRPAGMSLERLRKLAEALGKQPRTTALLLVLEDVSGSAAQWTELAELLIGLKAQAKQVAVFSEGLGNAGYAAVAGANLIVLPPSGGLELTGVGTELVSAGGLFRKLGLRPRFARRAAYKTSPELFTETEPSAAQRETAERLLGQTFEGLVADLVRRRGLSEAAVRAAIDAGPYTGRTALAAGLIEAIGFRDQMPAFMSQRFASRPESQQAEAPATRKSADKLPSAAVLERTARWAAPRLRPLRRPRTLALVQLDGTIRGGKSGRLPALGQMLGSETAVAALAAARRDRRSPSALVTIDSRGGSALASEIVWRELCRLSAAKPTRVYIDSVAASGGYLIACGAPRILSAPLAVVGSIGVFSGHFDLSGLLAWIGVRRDFLGRGARAGLQRSGELSESEWAAVESPADDTYQAFVALVAEARKKTLEETLQLAQGKVYTGREAAALGLVDRVCSFREAAIEAAEAGGLAPDVQLRNFADARAGLGAWLDLAGSSAAIAGLKDGLT